MELITGLDNGFDAIAGFRIFACIAGAAAVIEVFAARQCECDQDNQGYFFSYSHYASAFIVLSELV